MGLKQLTFASILVYASALGGGAAVANAQTPISNEPPEVGATTTLTEPSVEIDPQQEQVFQRKQKRRLAVGWTLMGAGTVLIVISAAWVSRTGGDPSVGIKRGLAVTIPGAAMVIAGGGVLIKRRIKKNEHDTATQVRVTPTSISVQGHF